MATCCRTPRMIFLLGFCMMLIFAAFGQAARKSRSAAPATVTSFDYYRLSLSWAPEFCAQPNQAASNPKECESGRGINFIVHGLWPQAETGKNPESCGPAKPVAKGIVNLLLPYMQSAGLIQ